MDYNIVKIDLLRGLSLLKNQVLIGLKPVKMSDIINEFVLTMKQEDPGRQPEVTLTIKGKVNANSLRDLMADSTMIFRSIFQRDQRDQRVHVYQVPDEIKDVNPGELFGNLDGDQVGDQVGEVMGDPVRPSYLGTVHIDEVGTLMTYDDEKLVQNAVNTGGYVRMLGRSDTYTVFFPRIRDDWSFKNKVAMNPGYEADQPVNMSWPVCSCKAYFYGNYRKGSNKEGSCRHIEACLPNNEIHWPSRPECYSRHCKEIGLSGFEWVPDEE